MKLIAYPLVALLILLGMLFVVGSQGQSARIVVGVILLLSGMALLWIAYQQPKSSSTTIVQKIDLSGDVHLKELTCRACGGTLSNKSISVQAGAVFVNCEYCGASYQIEEEPKW